MHVGADVFTGCWWFDLTYGFLLAHSLQASPLGNSGHGGQALQCARTYLWAMPSERLIHIAYNAHVVGCTTYMHIRPCVSAKASPAWELHICL